MTPEQAQKVLDELQGVRPEFLQGEAKKLFEAIMKIADERDEYKKMVDLMAKEISKNILNTCPLSDYNYDLDCENRCSNDYKECWKRYFKEKTKI